MRNLDKHVLCLLGPPRHLISTYKTERQKTNCEEKNVHICSIFHKKTSYWEQNKEVRTTAIRSQSICSFASFYKHTFPTPLQNHQQAKSLENKTKFQQFSLIESEILTINKRTKINKYNKSRKLQLTSNFTCMYKFSPIIKGLLRIWFPGERSENVM